MRGRRGRPRPISHPACPACPGWSETLHPAVDMIRTIAPERVKFLHRAPHGFRFGGDVARMIRHAAPVPAHVHVADTFHHRASSGLRHGVNPPGSTARVHRHLDIGRGEVKRDAFFGTLREAGFDGIVTRRVFAWQERAVESSRFMRRGTRRHAGKHRGSAAPRRRAGRLTDGIGDLMGGGAA